MKINVVTIGHEKNSELAQAFTALPKDLHLHIVHDPTLLIDCRPYHGVGVVFFGLRHPTDDDSMTPMEIDQSPQSWEAHFTRLMEVYQPRSVFTNELIK
jgi:hypothetical protein